MIKAIKIMLLSLFVLSCANNSKNIDDMGILNGFYSTAKVNNRYLYDIINSVRNKGVVRYAYHVCYKGNNYSNFTENTSDSAKYTVEIYLEKGEGMDQKKLMMRYEYMPYFNNQTSYIKTTLDFVKINETQVIPEITKMTGIDVSK